MFTTHHAVICRCVRGKLALLLRRFLLIFVSGLLLHVVPVTTTYADVPTPEPVTESADSFPSQSLQTITNLTDINKGLQDLNFRVEATRAQLQKLDPLRNSDEYSRLTQRLQQLEQERQNAKVFFEQIATGGVDKSVFSEPETKADFDWQNELLSVARPLLSELTKLTEQSRTLDNLRNEKEKLEEKMQVTRKALSNLRNHTQTQMNPATAEQINSLIEGWEQLHSDFKRQNHLLEIQINNQIGQEESLYTQGKKIVKDFFIGRGLVLIIALAALFLSVFIIQKGLDYFLDDNEKLAAATKTTSKRFLNLFLRTLGGLFSLILFLMILYLAGDVVLFSLIIVVLALLLLASRNYLPRYFEEAKLFVNAGPVREQERIIYRGLHWKVKSVGLKIWLENENLTNGELRLTLGAVKGLISRPIYTDEDWFPTRRGKDKDPAFKKFMNDFIANGKGKLKSTDIARAKNSFKSELKGDYVLLKDQTFGWVVDQTPEFVTLKVLGSTTTYRTHAFLSAQPKNLSLEGFVLNITTGIDLSHRHFNMETVANFFRQSIDNQLKDSGLYEHIEGIAVDFYATTRSSLDFQVLVKVRGSGAEHYFKLNRLIQAACISACNEHNWSIPIEQQKIYLPNPHGSKAQTSEYIRG